MINSTITGSTGAGTALTAAVNNGADLFILDTNNKTITLRYSNGKPDVCIAVAAATTYSLTVSGTTYTLTVS